MTKIILKSSLSYRKALAGATLLSLFTGLVTACGDTNFVSGGSKSVKAAPPPSAPVNPVNPGNPNTNPNGPIVDVPGGTTLTPGTNTINPDGTIGNGIDFGFPNFKGIALNFSKLGRYHIGNNDFDDGSCKGATNIDKLVRDIAPAVRYTFQVVEPAVVGVGVSHCGSDRTTNPVSLKAGFTPAANAPDLFGQPSVFLILSQPGWFRSLGTLLSQYFFHKQILKDNLQLANGMYSIEVVSGPTGSGSDIDDILLTEVQIAVRSGKVVLVSSGLYTP